MVHEPSVTPRYHLQKSGLRDLGEGLPVALAVRTTCEPTWDLHSAPPLSGPFAQAPPESNAQRGPTLSACPEAKDLISASPRVHGHPPCPHRADKTSLTRRGAEGSCSESPKPLGSLGPEVGLRPSILLPTPETRGGDGVHSFKRRHRQEGSGPRGCWSQPGPGQSLWRLQAGAGPGGQPLMGLLPSTTFLGLKNLYFLKTKAIWFQYTK